MRQLLLVIFIGLIGISCNAQPSFNKEEIVKEVAEVLDKNYVYPDIGQSMSEYITSQLEQGVYNDLDDPNDFASQLQSDLRSISNDKHIRVINDKERVNSMRNGLGGLGSRRGNTLNYGFEEVKILEGNIGYLDLRNFFPISGARKVAKEAMDKLIQSDAIIFDLRQNGGGSPEMIQFISSYLFGKESVHLNTFYWRPSDRYSETWTTPDKVSTNRPDIPVYILTSNFTFSAAEEFTYNLKNMKRAIVVGETTGGGAHPGGPSIINDSFILNVPRGRAINPITKTNWEGVGIKPHVETTSDKALDKAIELIGEL